MKRSAPDAPLALIRSPGVFVSVLVVMLCSLSATLTAQSTYTAPQYAERGESALFSGNYFLAIEEFQQALRLNPNYARALRGSAEAYYRLGEYDQAQALIVRAIILAPRDQAILVLAGRIAIGRGYLPEASSLFERVLASEPNNVDARLGQAELALARGRSSEAASTLDASLRLRPDHRMTLLSLVLVSEHIGDLDAAERYLDRARTLHRDDLTVQLLAAEYYLRAGRPEDAITATRIAQEIDPLSDAALALRSEASLLDRDYDQALELAERRIEENRADTGAWYIRAISQRELGDTVAAVVSIRTALRLDPGDELHRIWAEWVALTDLDLDHPFRAELAQSRKSEAMRLIDGFRFDRADVAYRRAVQLAPLDLDLRAGYAELLRRMNRSASYLQELILLRNDGFQSTRNDISIDLYERTLSSSVARRWGIDQFTLSRSRTRIALYVDASRGLGRYPGAELALTDFIRRSIVYRDGVEIVEATTASGFADTLSKARSQDVDYFILIDADADGRTFLLSGTVHVGRTGAVAAEIGAVRTGVTRVADTVESFVARLFARIPFQSTIARRRAALGVIDRGSRDGLRVGDELIVLDPTGVASARASLGFSYNAASRIGSATVVAADELISEVLLTPIGNSDLVSVGDMVLRIEGTAPDEEPDLFPLLYERLRRLR